MTPARKPDGYGFVEETPAWATDAEPYSGVPCGLYLPVDDPANLWARYARKVVEYTRRWVCTTDCSGMSQKLGSGSWARWIRHATIISYSVASPSR